MTFLKSEIQEEQWVRQMEPFRRFLQVAAQMNGQPLNYSLIGRDCGVSSLTVQSYYEILDDTLIGFFLPPFHRSIRKQQRKAPKFYFFDLGVKRALGRELSVPLSPQTFEFGKAFEHFIICEINRLNQYLHKDFEIFYLQTKSGVEIDLILNRPGKKLALVEIKSANQVDERHTRHLEEISAAIRHSEVFLLSLDQTPKMIGRVLALPWQEGITKLMD